MTVLQFALNLVATLILTGAATFVVLLVVFYVIEWLADL